MVHLRSSAQGITRLDYCNNDMGDEVGSPVIAVSI